LPIGGDARFSGFWRASNLIAADIAPIPNKHDNGVAHEATFSMKRKASKAGANSTRSERNGSKLDAPLIYRELEERVAVLEKIVTDLQSRDDEAGWTVPFGAITERVRPGPKLKYHRESFILWRNHLVEMLESHWPEIEPHCIPKVKADSLRAALEKIEKHTSSQHQLCANRLLQNFPVLLSFLASKRFRGDPRQIANALAGVPDIGFWRSLKIGQAEPCQDRIGQRALKSYIRRKHHGFYSELQQRINPTHFTNTKRAYRTKDKMIRDYYAQAIYEAWIAAKRRF